MTLIVSGKSPFSKTSGLIYRKLSSNKPKVEMKTLRPNFLKLESAATLTSTLAKTNFFLHTRMDLLHNFTNLQCMNSAQTCTLSHRGLEHI